MITKHTYRDHSEDFCENRMIYQNAPKPAPDTEPGEQEVASTPGKKSMAEVEKKWTDAHNKGEAELQAALNDTTPHTGPKVKVSTEGSTYTGAEGGEIGTFAMDSTGTPSAVNREAEAAIADYKSADQKSRDVYAGTTPEQTDEGLSDSQRKALDSAHEAAKKPERSFIDRMLRRNEEKKEEDKS